jgi:hypothetical protein
MVTAVMGVVPLSLTEVEVAVHVVVAGFPVQVSEMFPLKPATGAMLRL